MSGPATAGRAFLGVAALRRLAHAFHRLGRAIERRTPRFVKRIGAVTWALLDFTTDED